MKKVFVNKKTGERVEHELKNGAWVPVAGAEPKNTAPARQPMSYGETLLAAMPAGASFGFADEIRGGLEGAIAGAIPGGDSFQEAYIRGRDAQRGLLRQAREDNPRMALAGELAGGFAAPLPGMGWIKNAATAPAMAGRLATVGAGAGAVTGLGESASMEDAPQNMLLGAGIGAGAGPVLAGAGGMVGKIARGGYEGLTQNATDRASQNIRSRAQGISPAQIQAGLASRGSAAMLLDVDPSFTRIARGAALTSPDAERVAASALNSRQASAPDRMRGYLEQASGLAPADRAGAVRSEIDASRRALGPQYEALQQTAIPITPELQQVLDTPRMRTALRGAINNWMTRNPGAPDPTRAGGVLPADVVQEMKRVVDSTISSPTADPADQAAARAIKEALLQNVDPMIPGYPQLREQYAQEVMRPQEGLDIGAGLYSGREDRLTETVANASRLKPEGQRGYRAGALEDATNAVNYRAGTGDQFYGADILGGNMLGRDRAMQLTGGDQTRATDMIRQFEVERAFNQNRTSVLPGMGSQTASRVQSAGEVAQDAASVLTSAKTGGLSAIANRIGTMLVGDSPAVAEETMRILTKSGMTRAEIEALMSGYVPPSSYEALQRAAPILQRLGQSATGGILQPSN